MTTTSRNANAGWRTSQATPGEREQRDDAIAASVAASGVQRAARHPTCAPRRISTHRSAKDSPASRAAIGTRLWPVMPGDVFTSRNEHVPSARRIRSSAAPARAADDVESAQRLRADRAARCVGSMPAGQWYLRLVGEVLVLVVVVAAGRLDADQRQRAAVRGSPR